MNTPTPTPRTDAAWNATFDGEQMSAGRTARALRECSQQLETELTTLAAERDLLRAEVERLNAIGSWSHTCLHHNDKQRTECPVCLVTTLTAEGDQLRAELAAERARLDSGQILLTVAGERVWHSGVDLRAAIDAAMKEDAK